MAEGDIHEDVINRDVDDLDNISNDTHHDKAYSNSLRDLYELSLVRYCNRKPR